MKNSFQTMLQLGSQAALEASGVFNEPGPGRRAAGFARNGQQVFVLTALANSGDKNAGESLAHAYAATMIPFGIFGRKEHQYLSYLIAATKSERLLKVLDGLYDDRDGESFGATILKAVKTGHRHALGVVIAVRIYNNWGIMSPAMKAMSIAMLGAQSYLVEPGKSLCDLRIIDGKNQVITSGDVLTMLSKGKNPYGLVENWNQLRNLTRIYTDDPSVEAVIDFAEAHNLLSKAPNDSAVPGVSKKQILQEGGKPVPQYGVGAISAPKGKPVPRGYSKTVDTEDAQLMSPTANAKSAQGALQGSLVGTKAGTQGISAGAVGVYKNWKTDEKSAIDKGVEGGSALISGLTRLKDANSYLYGALVAFLTHYAGANKVPSATAVEYAASLSGIALARLISGRKDYSTDSEGVKVTSALASNEPNDFAKVQTELRALYASFRISSRADAYQLSNQAYAENRINETDLVSMHEVFDIIYGDNGLAATQRLMNGKNRGMEIARDKSAPPKNTMTTFKDSIHRKVLGSLSEEKRPRTKYVSQSPVGAAAPQGSEEGAPPGAEGPQPSPAAVPPQAESVPSAPPPGVG